MGGGSGILKQLTVRSVARVLDLGLVSATEVALFCHTMAVAGDEVWQLNAYETLHPWSTIQDQAQAADARRQHDQTRSILEGIPVSFKANIAAQQAPLTAGSAILGYHPGDTPSSPSSPVCGYDADVVRILVREKGAICLGMTSMDEFGMGSLGTNIPTTPAPTTNTSSSDTSSSSSSSHHNPRHVKNPLPFLRHLRLEDLSDVNQNNNTSIETRLAQLLQLPPEIIYDKHQEALESYQHEQEQNRNKDNNTPTITNCYYSAGGSSCGAAIAVAHGSSVVALGTDTGGSIRLPAAWCGVIGVKPSYGVVSRHGIVSYASSFDTVGVLTRSVDCAATVLDMITQRRPAARPPKTTTTATATTDENENENKNENANENEYISRDSTFTAYNEIDENNKNNSLLEVALAETLLLSEEKDDNVDDTTKKKEPSSTAATKTRQPLAGIRIGIPSAFSIRECPEEIRKSWSQAAEWLQQHGAEITTISTQDLAPELIQRALSAYYVLVSAEAMSNLSRYDGFRYGVAATAADTTSTCPDEDDDTVNHNVEEEYLMTPLERQYAATRTQGFGEEVKRRILCGASVLSADKFHTYYEAAAQIRATLAQEFASLLEGDHNIDLLLIPTVLSLPPQITPTTTSTTTSVNDTASTSSTAMFANDIMTVPASLAGLPAISIPVHVHGEETFMAGMQLIASRLDETTLIKSAKILEQQERK